MSTTARCIKPGKRWAWVISYNGQLNGADFKVLSAIAYRAMNGSCYPSHACLMRDTGLSRSGVRKAIGSLARIQAITVSGSGGRRPDGGGLSCTFRLNISPEGQVNVSPEAPERVTDAASTCHQTGVNVSLEEPQKISKENRNIQKGGDAPDGAGGISSCEEASSQQVDFIVRLAKQSHPGLKWLPGAVIAQSVNRYSRSVCEKAWVNCDRHPPEGTEGTQHYAYRFTGRKSPTGGWDTYKPQRKRDALMSAHEASAWIQDLRGEAQP